jgi:TetR/AcrR family transcriptional regulator
MTRGSSAAIESGGDTRERILVAALEAFTEKGFDGASTRDIAARAGVNLGLLQYYFGGKLKLWQAAVDRAFVELENGVESVLEDPTVANERDRSALLIRNFVRFVARHSEFVHLMHEEGKRRGPRMRWLVDRHVKPIYEAVSELMNRGRESGVLRSGISQVHFHYILVGAVTFIFHQAEECKRLTGIDPRLDSVVEEHASAIEQLLLGTPTVEARSKSATPNIE